MSAEPMGDQPVTYTATEEDLATVIDFVSALTRRGVDIPRQRPALVSADNSRMELPGPVFEALKQVAASLARGQGVTVAPQDSLLTTQQAADFLGISRPTVIRLLERGEISFQMRGRHRRLQLRDVLAYQNRTREDRRQILDSMAGEAQDVGLYEATLGPMPPRR